MSNNRVNIYLNDGRRLDMFQDETIKFTSKLTDIEKLSNLFIDFSNDFSVPSTSINDDIFKHYFDVDIDNTFNANIRINVMLEVGPFPLRVGKLQLEKVLVKEGRPSSYNVSFFGGLKQLDDLFGDDTLDRLDYKKNELEIEEKLFTSLSQYDYEWNSTNFINSINLPTWNGGHIITPLIAYGDKDWNWGGGSGIAVKDISVSGGAIVEEELRPAMRVKKVLEAIETKYDLNFSNDFFGKAHFRNLFMWLNENKDYNLSQEYTISFDSSITGIQSGDVVLEDGYIKATYPKWAVGWNIWRVLSSNFTITPSNPLYKYEAWVVDDRGEKIKEWGVLTGTKNLVFFLRNSGGRPGGPNKTVKYRLVIKPYQTNTFTISTNIKNYQRKRDPNNVGIFIDTIYDDCVATSSLNATIKVRIEDNMPKLKVKDFISGLMKMYKLVIRPTSVNSFYVGTLDHYYSLGKTHDITEWVDWKEASAERPKIYKNIIFKFQKTNNFLSATYRKLNDPQDELGYGDLKAQLNYIEEKNELKVELPFENMMFDRMSTSSGEQTDLTVGLSAQSADLGATFTKNKSKPVLFYLNGYSRNYDYKIYVSFLGNTSLATYTYNIGNTDDIILDQVTNTLNFNSEVDTWHQEVCETSLYKNYWENWIETIYSTKQRKFKFKSQLPTSIIDELSLNDRLIIGDKRYKIDDYSIDLTTNKVDLNLFTDIYDFTSGPQFGTASIITNIGNDGFIELTALGKYYGIDIHTITGADWSVSKIDTGDGTSWIQVNNTTGISGDELLFYVTEKGSQVPPDVYKSRQLNLKITSTSGSKTITIFQQGL